MFIVVITKNCENCEMAKAIWCASARLNAMYLYNGLKV